MLRLVTAAAATSGLSLLIPLGLHTPISGGGYDASNNLGFYRLNPLRMLFTNYRGLFIWSPVAALAIPGLVWLYKSRPANRRFLVAAIAMALGIVCSYAFVPYWDGAWSYGQRYYAPLYPLIAVGVAGLLQATRGTLSLAVVGAIMLSTLRSLYLCFNLVILRPVARSWDVTVPVGAAGVAQMPATSNTSVGSYLWAIYPRSRLLRPLFAWPGSRSRASGRLP